MSRLCAPLSLGVALLCLVPTPRLAQTAPVSNTDTAPVSDIQQELLLEIDSLLERSREAKARLLRTRQHHLEVMREPNLPALDTVHVASLRIVTPPDQAELAAELFTEVMRESFPGVERHGAFDGVWFPFQWNDRLEPIVVAGTAYPTEILNTVSRGGVKEHIEGKVWTALTSHVLGTESGLSGWGLVPDFQAPEQWHPRVYRELATMPARVARSCLAQDSAACWSMLGLDEGPDPVREWYTPEERRALVARAEHWVERAAEDLFVRCTDQGSTGACDELIAFVPRVYWEVSSARARTIMVSLALEAGGVSAWARLLETPSMPPGDALRHISGLSTEELSTRWRDLILAARPNVHAGFGLTQLATALWVLLLAALATRSTRWRLG